MEIFTSTFAGLAAARFSNPANAENTDKTAAARMDAGPVGGARRRKVRTFRTFNNEQRRRFPSPVASARAMRSTKMRNFSARDAARKFGELLDAADAGPVVIRRHGRPRAAVIGWALFRDYRNAYEEHMRDRQVEALELALNSAIDGKTGTAWRARALAKRLGAIIDRTPEHSPTDEKAGA